MKLLKTITLSTVLISSISYASLQDCMQAGKSENYQGAIKACLPYAKSNINATAILAGSYGVTHQYEKSAMYYQIYIDKFKQGDDKTLLATSYQVLGNLYYFGKGIPKNIQKGLAYITKGAELGNTTAQKQLGDIFANSKNSVTTSVPIAYQWYEISMINGDNDANSTSLIQQVDALAKQNPYCIALGQDNVGQAYYQGIGGLEQSNSEALEWMQKAENTDPTLSVTNLDLAKMYHINGDDNKAFEYSQKATSQPLAQAMQYLGTLYQQGAGTEKDPVKTYAYLTLAVDLYNNPDTDFWNKFAAPCMPNYQGTTKEFNVDVAKQQLGQISLNDQQKEQANKLIDQVKSKFK